jgi:hypothetical protein
MQATTVTQAITVMPATSNFKDDVNIMTAHNRRKASNSRNESNGPPTHGSHQKQLEGEGGKVGSWRGRSEGAEGCLQKLHGRSPTAAGTIGTSQRQQQKEDP